MDQQPPQQPYSGQQWNQQPSQQPYYPQQPYGQAPYSPPQPYGQPQFQQPPKRRNRGCIIGGLVGAIVIVLAILVCAVSQLGSKGVATNTVSSQQNVSRPTSSGSQVYNVGDKVTIDGWDVTVNSVQTDAGNDVNVPKSGNLFLLIDVSIVNNTGANHTFSSLLQFSLKDTQGQSYNETIDTSAPNSPDGAVASGSPLKGTLAYEVPASNHEYRLQFLPDLISKDTCTWKVIFN